MVVFQDTIPKPQTVFTAPVSIPPTTIRQSQAGLLIEPRGTSGVINALFQASLSPVPPPGASREEGQGSRVWARCRPEKLRLSRAEPFWPCTSRSGGAVVARTSASDALTGGCVAFVERMRSSVATPGTAPCGAETDSLFQCHCACPEPVLAILSHHSASWRRKGSFPQNCFRTSTSIHGKRLGVHGTSAAVVWVQTGPVGTSEPSPPALSLLLLLLRLRRLPLLLAGPGQSSGRFPSSHQKRPPPAVAFCSK